MDIPQTVQEILNQFVSLSFRDFRQWFVVNTWDIHLWATPEVQEVVNKIKLFLAEYTSDVWSENELKEKLLEVLTCTTHCSN